MLEYDDWAGEPDPDEIARYDAQKPQRCGCGWDSPCECPRQCDVCTKWRAVDGPVCEDCWEHAPKCNVCTEYPVRKRGDVCRECDLVEVGDGG